MTPRDLWAFGDDVPTDRIGGYKVVANDGEIGHVDYATGEAGKAHVVVDTSGWLPGVRTLIPAAAVRDVNHESATIQVDLTKDEVREAPPYVDDTDWATYQGLAAGYWGPLGRWAGLP
jgi:hypothetical protein